MQDGAGDALSRVYEGIVAEARARVAAGRDPNVEALAVRVRQARRLHGAPAADAGALERAELAALQRLEHVAAVQRARARLARRTKPPPGERPAASRRRPALRTRPAVSGNMDVRRPATGVLGWDAVSAVVEWEVRISERADDRRDYAVRDTLSLPGAATSFELPLGDTSLRVHLLGRGRGGRLVRRAVITGLTRDSWDERWQRRASAS